MKKLMNLKSIVLVLVVVLITSCSKDSPSIEMQEKDNLPLLSRPGEYEIGVSEQGLFRITADIDTLIYAFQERLGKQKIEGTIIGVEIVKAVIEDEEEGEDLYLLYAYNSNYTVKMGVFINYSNGRFAVESLDKAFAAPFGSLTCTSTNCGTRCAPSAVRNPDTGKLVASCSTCSNSCTKTATINF